MVNFLDLALCASFLLTCPILSKVLSFSFNVSVPLPHNNHLSVGRISQAGFLVDQVGFWSYHSAVYNLDELGKKRKLCLFKNSLLRLLFLSQHNIIPTLTKNIVKGFFKVPPYFLKIFLLLGVICAECSDWCFSPSLWIATSFHNISRFLPLLMMFVVGLLWTVHWWSVNHYAFFQKWMRAISTRVYKSELASAINDRKLKEWFKEDTSLFLSQVWEIQKLSDLLCVLMSRALVHSTLLILFSQPMVSTS